MLFGHTALRTFRWFDYCSWIEAAQNTPLDPMLCALRACHHLRKVAIKTTNASCDAMKNLLQLKSATDLHLLMTTDQWLAVADEIRRGRCNARFLDLAMYSVETSVATEAIIAVASAIRLDQNPEHVTL
jgi:hypothetical protein